MLRILAVTATLAVISVLPQHGLAAGPALSGVYAIADTPETVYSNPAGMTRL